VLVIVTEGREGALPKVILTLAGGEIEALLAGSVERFPVQVGPKTYDVEMIAASTPTPKSPPPNVRLRVANDALGASRAGTVTPLFPDPLPFVLVLTCSDPPLTKVRLGPGLTYERIDMRSPARVAPRPPDDEPVPLKQRFAIGLFFGAMMALGGWLQERDAPLYYLAAIGIVIWSVFGKTNPRAKR
jgi:hypothetical protein